ncbi:MAG: carboxy terminal-processing peptidase [Spirochaetes bacterium]|nr:carboxy terminal-processing peptidase [Spirochaetota bacterium]
MRSHRYSMKVLVYMMTFIMLIFGCTKKSNGLTQQNVNLLIREFLKFHVTYNTFNDTLSERTLENMLSYLDPGKYFFYKSDVERFMIYKHSIDDQVMKNDYQFLNDIIEVYKKRYHEKIRLFEKLVVLDYDFSKDEMMVLDRDKIDYVKNAKEDEERWKKNIKLQLLNYLAVVKDVGQAREKLKKKYRLALKKVEEFDDEKKYAFFLNSFSMALDPHSNYLTKEEHEDFMIQTNLKLEGIGVMLRSEDGFVMVEHVMPNGAADKLPEPIRLKPNDKIIAVAQGDGEPVDVIDMDLRDVVKMIRGPKGTEVRLTILRKEPERKEPVRMVVPIVREVINLEEQAAKSEVITVGEGASAKKIGYIRLPSFYLDFDAAQRFDPNTKSSFRDMVNILTSLKNDNVDAVVLDLRGNPGGALDEAINIAGLFIDRGPILQIKGLDRWGNRDSIKVLNDNYPGVLYAGPLVLLVDKFSASAAEILAGAIRDYKRGIIIGPTNTFGKGTVQSYQKLLEGLLGAIKITTGIFYQPGGTSNHLYGIQPHIIVPDLSAIWDIGEDKLKYPLKWERIPQTNFLPEQKYINTQILSSLIVRSSERIKRSEKFKKLEEKIARLRAVVNSKVISLKKEAESIDREIKEVEQETRKARKKELIDLENDLFLQEALNIAADYVGMLER